MKIAQFKKLVARYYRKRASKAERYIIDRWYDSFDLDKSDLSWPDGTESLLEIENRIIKNVLNRSRPVIWYRTSWTKIAASILLIASVSAGIYFLSLDNGRTKQAVVATQTFTTEAGQLKKLTLPDSTHIMLNANSTLEILPGYGTGQRQVKLSGEAYFEVSKDPRHPFIVRTPDLRVKVIGTSFNVQAYSRFKDIKVSVSTGIVEVLDEERTLARLQADQQVAYRKATGEYTQENIGLATPMSWTTGTVVLDRAGFDELAQTIYNMYGLEIKSTDKEVLEKVYNLTIRSKRSYRQTMEQLCAMINKHYRKEGKYGIVIY